MKKKLLIISSTLNTGGAQRAFANLSIMLQDEYEVDFVLNDAVDISYEYKGNIIDLGFQPKKNKNSIWYQTKVIIRRLKKVRQLKESGEYAACISGLTSANAVNVLTKTSKCKTIISIRNFLSKSKLDGLKELIRVSAIRSLYGKADKIVAVSKSAGKDVIQNFKIPEDKITIIYNGYPLKLIREKAAEELSKKEKVLFSECIPIITAGRLTDAKGQWYLIRAMQEVVKCEPKARLFILGEGELKKFLVQLVKGFCLEKHVVFVGFTENPYKYMQRSKVFVLTSLYEGFPNVLAEAMCCGIPVISTDFDSGAREILAPDTPIEQKTKDRIEFAEYGILCPCCDGEKYDVRAQLTKGESLLAEAILCMIKDADVREKYIQKSIERAKQFRAEIIAEQWIKVIK